MQHHDFEKHDSRSQDAHESKKIRALIVDDERLARSNLIVLLKGDPQIEVIGECESGKEAINAIRTQKPDLAFLDVQMPECDGFDVLEQLGSAIPPAIVFVTAYDHYALRAFEAGALDYLLKPFDNARFALALARAKEKIQASKIAARRPECFAIKSVGQVSFVKLADIDWIEAADYYVSLHVGSRAHLLRRSITELEEELDPGIFCRIHRSTIVRLSRISGLKIGEDGEYDVVLEDETRLALSRRYRKDLQTRLGLKESQLR